jgi:hypothetical protein
VLPELQHTVRTLLEVNGSLLSTVVLRNEAAVDAHMSILRFHERTWMVQHLAAMPMTARGLDTSARLTLGFTYYGRLRKDIGWVKMFFRPNNPWPARVFGGYARRLGDVPTSDLRTFHYLPASTQAHDPTVSPDITVTSATPDDLGVVQAWFSSRGRLVEIEANDLRADAFALASLGAAYQSLGLRRQRECLVARRDRRIAGVALLDIASLGLNFSELTNAFTVHMVDDDEDARLALIVAAKARYRDLGRPQCIALSEDEDLSAFASAGFAHAKDYTCWTFHRDHLAGMEEYFLDMFGARRRRAK